MDFNIAKARVKDAATDVGKYWVYFLEPGHSLCELFIANMPYQRVDRPCAAGETGLGRDPRTCAGRHISMFARAIL